MPLAQAQDYRLHSVSGEIDQIDYDVDGDPIFIATAPFAAPDGAVKWFIQKITYSLVGTPAIKCPTLTERSGTRQKWDDRASDAIMGWRP